MQAYNATFKLVAPAVTSGANNTTATVLAFADYLCEDAQTPPEYRQTTENFMVRGSHALVGLACLVMAACVCSNIRSLDQS